MRPFVVSIILTPFLLLIGFMSGGAGHGSYFFAKVLFPYTMLSTVITEGTITIPFLIIALLQFPAYGVALGLMNIRSALSFGIVALTILHLGVVAAVFVLVGENFS